LSSFGYQRFVAEIVQLNQDGKISKSVGTEFNDSFLLVSQALMVIGLKIDNHLLSFLLFFKHFSR